MFEKLLSGQPSGIFGIGYEDPTTVGIICTIILLIMVVSGVRVVFAASIAGIIGLVEFLAILLRIFKFSFINSLFNNRSWGG